jgi:hypothetical protein
MILIKRFSSPLGTVIRLMADAAPVFRRACPEPAEQLVNLPRIILSNELNLRNFAVTDVLLSVTMARPMFFRYDIACTPEMYDRMLRGESGLEWLHGIPDQFLLLLAWINGLYEEFGSNIDPGYVAQIETQIRAARIAPNLSVDPVRTIWRVAVQECWRQTMYIYLYMVS